MEDLNNQTNQRNDSEFNQNNELRGDDGERRYNERRENGERRYNDRSENGERRYNDRRENGERRYNDRSENGSRYRRNRQEEQQVPVDTEQFKNDEASEKLIQPIDSFEELNLDDKILRGIFGYGFEKPSPIQARAIRPFINGRDIIAQAQSGTGKTGTFCLSVLGKIDFRVNQTQALILAHTRELASQIDMVIRQLGFFTDLVCNLSVKGVPIGENIEALCKKPKKPHVVIGTPGRILDMINKRAINVSTIKMLVIDEADEMLSKGFLDQIHKVIISLSNDTQVGLYSATMGPNFFEISKKFMRNPVNILVKAEQLTLEGISQYYIDVQKNDYKFDTLCDLYSILTITQSMIYCNSRRIVEDLANRLMENNFTVSTIHGDLSAREREETMAEFRNGKSRVLISTDLLSRGIDVQQVSVVINYDVPSRVESYLHRIGRSGRFGRKGTAINFVTYYDSKKVQNIEQYYNTQIQEMPADVAGIIE
jgi:translation initiation factor 4A